MDIKHLQFSFRMYWANMKGLLNMVAEGIILVASLASLFILVYQFGFKYSAHVTHMLETSRVLSPAGFLYRDIAPVYFEIQRDHTRKDVIPGYRHLFFPLCRAIGQKYSSNEAIHQSLPYLGFLTEPLFVYFLLLLLSASICRGRHSRCYKAISSRPSCSC